MPLKFFTLPTILKQIGHPRLTRFFRDFTDELQAANISLPGHDPTNDEYFVAVAALLASPAFPERLLHALALLEFLVAPENVDRLDAEIARRLPSVHLPGTQPAVDRALELWFWSPEALTELAAACPAPLPAAPHPTLSASASPPSKGLAPEGERDQGRGVAHQSTHPPIHQSTNPLSASASLPSKGSAAEGSGSDGQPSTLRATPGLDLLRPVIPWPEPVDGRLLLDALLQLLIRFVVLPKWAAETLALWILHTFAFELRDVCAYIGVESPTRRCGKTTLLTLLSQLINRPLVAANVSSPSFFRAIQELNPTLMIEEADRFLKGKHDLQGILNAGYNRKTAYVLRVAQQLSGSGSNGKISTLAFFSCWCPKVISQIGRLPGTLADRCIIVRMQRKTSEEPCERARMDLDTTTLRRQCVRFVLDHAKTLATARPQLPEALNDRAADIWEPLLALADLAGGPWPEQARRAALNLSAGSQDTSPIGSLLLDIFIAFASSKADRLFTRDLVAELNGRRDRPWGEMLKGKEVTERWLAFQLRPFNIKPRNLLIGGLQAKGYYKEDFMEAFRRYISRSELQALTAEFSTQNPPPDDNGEGGQPGQNP